MYCKNCGAQINDDAVFCEKCGSKQESTHAEHKNSGDNLKKHFNSSLKKIIMIGGIFIVVFIIISAVLNHQNKSSLDADTIIATQKATKKTTTSTTKAEEVDYIPTEPLYSFSGTGDDVITDISIEDYAVVKAMISGRHYCSVKAHGDSDSYSFGDILVSDTAPYSGESILFPDNYSFEINAQGSWTIEIFDMSYSTTDSFEGKGDTVTPIFTASSSVYEITTIENQGYFSVKGYYGYGDYDILVNTTDEYSGKVYFPVKGEYAFFVISGSREFTIRPVKE